MGWRGTVLLGALLVGAVVYAWLDVSSDTRESFWQAVFHPRPTPPAEAVERLFAFDPNAVTAIQIEQRAGLRLQLRRDGNSWQHVRRPEMVDEFLGSLGELAEILVLHVDEAELSEYGLAPPRAVIELQQREAGPIVLLIGERNPAATAVYAQVGRGGPVVLTGALILWELEKVVKEITGPVPAAANRRRVR